MPVAIAQASHSMTLKNIDRHERIRLMHLGAPLDTATSFLDMVSPTIAEFVDSAPSIPPTPITAIPQPMSVKRQRRQGCIFNNSPASSSTSSLDSFQSSDSEQSDYASSSAPSSPCSVASFEQSPPAIPETKPLRLSAKKSLPAPLILRFRAAPNQFLPLPPSPSLRFTEDFIRPVSPPASPAYTNVSPTTAERRQRRFNKLTRTLGENVPMDLIQTPAFATFAERGNHKHSYSESSTKSPSSPYASFAPSPLAAAGPSRRVMRGRSMTLDSLSSSATRHAGLTALGLHHAAKLSVENTNPAPTLQRITSGVSRPTNSKSGLKPLFPAFHRRERGNTTGVGARLGLDWGKRKEKEWSGEWNLRDVKDVVRGLRELKGR
ncbi:hypothetical protein BDN72DRAFT_849506 [Pluteus cervinus]|uniref:Uncharacterized protein n=1 Tax=Pluteus cervinus TaxID=181527 RepID=A0ACD3A9V9_9AGAR|nr:hypothetical protein BDN72DRAFT_849506 [Pluteus cervinus]